MTVSKTILTGMRFVRMGQPFVQVAAKSTIDTTNISGYIDKGLSFYGPGNDTSPPVVNVLNYPIRYGQPFKWFAAKSSIDASNFNYITMGQPFWAEYTAPPPPSGFDATRMFIIF